MKEQSPLVSVSMVAFHAEDFIAEAIEGVLRQKVNFSFELVIGDDCSKDDTRAICEAYAKKYPDVIRLLPPEVNLGIGANTARTMGSCRGVYIAVCDGDDVWTDPDKLQRQVDFLEKNPDYGVVYTDVETIDENGDPVDDPEQDDIRQMYVKGDVFLHLLQANFVNNSTAVFRREFLADHVVFPDRSYQIPDYLRWLHIATRAKFQFFKAKTTAYRRHRSGLSKVVSRAVQEGNRRAYQLSLFKAISDFDRHNKRVLSPDERKLVFRKILSLLYRRQGTLGMKLRILRLLPKYFPGLKDAVKIGLVKLLAMFPAAVKNALVPHQ